MKLADYVHTHAERGACTCGKCFDAPENPETKQPKGHTVNMTFFEVCAKADAKADEFLALVKAEFPHWLDGQEHSYLEVGADIGDQGIAITAIGLGHLLGVWKALTPDTLMPFLDPALKQQMAGMGMLALKTA